MMKTTRVSDLFQRQSASNFSANQNKKSKQKLKPTSQKTTALNPNPIKLIPTSHSNFSFRLLIPTHAHSTVKVSLQYIISFKNFRWSIYLV